MLTELGMNTNDFNYGQTIFLVSFLSAELPSGLISKKLGPDRYILSFSACGECRADLPGGQMDPLYYFCLECHLGGSGWAVQ